MYTRMCNWVSLLYSRTWTEHCRPAIMEKINIPISFIYLFFVFLSFSGAAPVAYGASQAMGLIRAVAASLHQSHSSARSKPYLQPTPQLTATLDPEPTEQGQGSNLQPHGS